MEFRKKITDLALEVHEINSEAGKDDGIITRESTDDGIAVTTVEIKSGEGEKLSGKSAGLYITADIGQIWKAGKESFDKAAHVLSRIITSLLPEKYSFNNGLALVAGLGNEEITADSVGPRAVSKILVTRHMKALNRKLFDTLHFGSVAAVSAGVLGQTGIESAEIVASVVSAVSPQCVIVIDALASRRLSRLATTIQFTDTGIAPGSGVANHRKELSGATLGVPVISIGIPTVVDAATLVYDLLDEIHISENLPENAIEKALADNGRNFFITLKESDVIIKETSRLIAAAINLTFHNSLSLDEIADYA